MERQNQTNVKETIKKRSRKILFVASSLAIGVGCYSILKFIPKRVSGNKNNFTITAERPINLPDLGIGKLTDCLKYKDGTTELWLDNIPITEAGNLGKSILDNVPDISEKSEMWILTCIKDKQT